MRACGPSGIMGEGAEFEGRELVGTGTCSDGVGVPGVGVDSGCTLAWLVLDALFGGLCLNV